MAPEVQLRAARAELDRTVRLLGDLSDAEWRQPTVLPFWRVREVVGHLYVVGGFFTSTSRVISRGVADGPPADAAWQAINAARMPVLWTLHESNIQVPRLVTRLWSRPFLTHVAQASLGLLARHLDSLTPASLQQVFPFFRFRISTSLYFAVLAKEMAVHRWEIEQALHPAATLDPACAALLPALLWAGAPLSSRPSRQLRGTVLARVGGEDLAWQIKSGVVRAVKTGDVPAPEAVLTAAPDTFALAALGRVPLERVEATGDVDLGRAFLSAFSYRAGAMPFFNP